MISIVERFYWWWWIPAEMNRSDTAARCSVQRFAGRMVVLGTIGDNIRLGRLEATDYELLMPRKRLNADHFIRTMPVKRLWNGNYPHNNVFSRSKATIDDWCASDYFDPKILILDEATSSVDTRLKLVGFKRRWSGNGRLHELVITADCPLFATLIIS